MTALLRVGVVGAGKMGRNHLRTLQRRKDVELVGLVDTDSARASEAATQYGCAPYDTVDELASQVDAIVIANPSSLHAETAIPLLERGISCLVEKPLATSEADCLAIITAAEKSGAGLLVGHIERFNPVVQHLSELLQGSRVFALDVRRMSSVSSRITDVDVVSDLMVHDLDIVRAIVGSLPLAIHAVGTSLDGRTTADYASATLRFPGGEIANIISSRITQNKIRDYHVTSDLGSITADLLGRELLVHRQSTLAPLTVGRAEFALDLSIDRVFVRDEEPLFAEIAHFVDVARGAAVPVISGDDALASMRLVWEVQRSLELR